MLEMGVESKDPVFWLTDQQRGTKPGEATVTELSHLELKGRAVNSFYPFLSLHLACVLSPQFSFLDCMSPSYI